MNNNPIFSTDPAGNQVPAPVDPDEILTVTSKVTPALPALRVIMGGAGEVVATGGAVATIARLAIPILSRASVFLFLLSLPGDAPKPPEVEPVRASKSTLTEAPNVIEEASTTKSSTTTPQLMTPFSKSIIDEVLASSARPRNEQITEGKRAIEKKLGHAEKKGIKSAFEGVKPTQKNAEEIIKDILEHPTDKFIGDKVIDVYNTKGQGVRFEKETLKFEGFLEKELQTQ